MAFALISSVYLSYEAGVNYEDNRVVTNLHRWLFFKVNFFFYPCITIKDHTASHGAGLPLSDCVQAGPQHGRGQEGSGAGLPGLAVSTKLGP